MSFRLVMEGERICRFKKNFGFSLLHQPIIIIFVALYLDGFWAFKYLQNMEKHNLPLEKKNSEICLLNRSIDTEIIPNQTSFYQLSESFLSSSFVLLANSVPNVHFFLVWVLLSFLKYKCALVSASFIKCMGSKGKIK